ncbi:tetratricopeptide repeat protein [Desulfopila sp. IMCC35008]|uniref:tetratricopeptide repeat protein n=1 Tax=Desulfopila sp. IMCC35008 TaxID=2653858 RepID=UPI0013CFA21B|nr:tetratricopeptide repeat protein [Desulfopila sp. IMCC35008]
MDTSPPSPEKHSNRWQIAALGAALLILTAPFIYLQRPGYTVRIPEQPAADFIGSNKCNSCHKTLFDKWQESHHDLAMDVATEKTVLGDFDNATFTDPHNSVTSRFFKQDGKFHVETEGPEGNLQEFIITHTFGVYPLQQYLIPFPGGKLQCLNIAWDARNDKWYRLPPYQTRDTNDWLHWTKGGQTWNGMCAECHSTRLQKQFNMADNSYTTSWFEIDVGCEACHGPGSAHARWAELPEMARPSVPNSGLTVDTGPNQNNRQIAICAPCHSRRYQLGDNVHNEGKLLDKLVPALLEEGLYYADGQILEEVYVYGSFTQSKMYMHDVRCNDCHDVHSLKLHKEENDLCLQCHQAESYDTPTHHFHKRVHEGKPSDGHLCVKCHMPGTTYMGIDYRPDHSIRIPRPDLSLALRVPNSCSTTDCHGDKGLDWVNENYTKWYGTARKPHYGEILAAGRTAAPESMEKLIRLAEDTLYPPIVRATALALLSRHPHEATEPIFTRALEDENDLIRHTAIRNLNHLAPETRTQLLEPKLYDKVKGVRIEAASALAAVPPGKLRPENRVTFQKVLAEYRTAMEYNSDFAPQRFNLGNLEAALGKTDSAISYYRQAMRIDSQFYQAKVNLAMQLNQKGENTEAAKLLRQVVNEHPNLHEISYSLGLLLAEMGNYQDASTYLGKAADGMPGYTRPRYNQALALLKLQKWEEGEQALLQALTQEPENQEYFMTLVNLYLNFRMVDKARSVAKMILEMVPDHQQARELLQQLK